MLNNIDILSAILAFFILYLAFAFFSKLRQEDVFKARLKELMDYKEYLLQKENVEARMFKRPEDQSFPGLRKFIAKLQRSSDKERDDLKRLFDKAGLKSQNAYVVYGIAKIVMIFPPAALVGVLVYYFTEWNLLFKVSAVLAAALIGSYIVDFILRRLVDARQSRIRKAFPEALDLMVICTEAGLSLTATVQRVAREISQISPDLGYELALLSIELNMLPDRNRALQNFSDRLDSPYFKSIVTNIMQAEQYGTPIAQTMRTVAEQFRLDRLVEAEERAAKLPVLMTLPMMLFIFPCIYIVILGPAIISVMETFV